MEQCADFTGYATHQTVNDTILELAAQCGLNGSLQGGFAGVLYQALAKAVGTVA